METICWQDGIGGTAKMRDKIATHYARQDEFDDFGLSWTDAAPEKWADRLDCWGEISIPKKTQ